VIYFDTAYLAKCYLNEPGSTEIRALAASAGRVACCEIGKTELAAVLHRQRREGHLTDKTFRITRAQREFDEQAGLWTWLPLPGAMLEKTAQELLDLSGKALFLRAADAIHLVCARENGFREIHTNDRHMLAASAAFGLKGVNILRNSK